MNTDSFYYYLKNEELAESSIQQHIKNLKSFTEWIKETALSSIESITYNELLNYVQHLKKRELVPHTINTKLNTLRKYYEHLKEEGKAEHNPARRLFIKGELKRVIVNPLNYQELEQLYNEYAKPKTYREEKGKRAHQRNKIILGIMLWQGAHSGELKKMEPQHVNIEEGSIYIPGAARSRSRELKLHSKQIISIHEYLKTLSPEETKLFPCHVASAVEHIIQEIKGINTEVTNSWHIRASVLLHWMKMYDKRQVQYMAGHKWISSTEQYEVQELQSLTDQLTRHHPFS